jgi:cobalt/nickel transport system permease protein
MHIPDGLLPAQVIAGGYALTGLATWYTLRQINRHPNSSEAVPKAALLTAAFFMASSIHIPIPPASVHLILNGLLGVILGYYAFPAILIGLFFQAIMFGHGGLTTLGVNAAILGIPALFAYYVYQLYPRFQPWLKDRTMPVFGFIAGAFGLGLATLVFLTLVIAMIPSGFDATAERMAIYSLAIAHIPLMLIEGVFTAMLLIFLQRVKPEMLN